MVVVRVQHGQTDADAGPGYCDSSAPVKVVPWNGEGWGVVVEEGQITPRPSSIRMPFGHNYVTMAKRTMEGIKKLATATNINYSLLIQPADANSLDSPSA
ncbi:hypothetical protein MGYG_01200 [Nannizzia gypsea CBS 118893]|uniref:Uncharacterized protein n=1 Tax=Arthroderma gypseum (strain ATCC MYA-4604 / CBS 118893) TaxID=535722 RepID=E5QZE6_ARTGP|nr:hypothetical protein MGYG_01200 [Nannizzia gypsea CBS 118893]EFQ98164.1 hypothetical protein MGYG_01200 [Nannizzia gypsea CBS 118893]